MALAHTAQSATGHHGGSALHAARPLAHHPRRGLSQSTQHHPPTTRATQDSHYCRHNARFARCLLESTQKSITNLTDALPAGLNTQYDLSKTLVAGFRSYWSADRAVVQGVLVQQATRLVCAAGQALHVRYARVDAMHAGCQRRPEPRFRVYTLRNVQPRNLGLEKCWHVGMILPPSSLAAPANIFQT